MVTSRPVMIHGRRSVFLVTMANPAPKAPQRRDPGATHFMVTKRLFRSALHRTRRPGAAGHRRGRVGRRNRTSWPRCSPADPAPEVRIAAANRCANLGALAAAWESEADPAVRAALARRWATCSPTRTDGARAAAFLDADRCTDAIRVEVARRAPDGERRRSAIAAIRDEAPLIELALTAEHAETRMAAADARAHAGGAAQARRRGAGTRITAWPGSRGSGSMRSRERESGLPKPTPSWRSWRRWRPSPGPILTAVIELNRRWQALDLGDDPPRLARCDAARQTLQARFDREHDEQRARTRFEHRLTRMARARRIRPATSERSPVCAASLPRCAKRRGSTRMPRRSRLDEAEQRIERWAQELQALAGVEALVVEAEQLAAGTSIDDAKLPERWQALDRSIRTPALTRRFEAALIVIEQRRLAQIRAAEQEAQAARQQLHALLHTRGAGARRRSTAGCARGRRRDPGAQGRRRRAAEADACSG